MSRKKREMASEAASAPNDAEMISSLLSKLPSRGLFASGSVSLASYRYRASLNQRIASRRRTDALFHDNYDTKNMKRTLIIRIYENGGIRLYVCDHETAPPEDQIIKTDQTNILIRSLTIKKTKSESKAKEKPKAGAENAKGKRPAERPTDDKNISKKANTGAGSSNRKENGLKSLSEKDIQNCTVEKLRSLLRERNLPRTGKKEELVARLKKFLP